jgi:TetR/AcrR family transcriptional regulator, fatty acid biosynthesis regulator
MSIREERKQQSRQAIIDAALQLSTSGRSFSNISLREVTRIVGLVPTAFYRHFDTMDALALEIVDQVALHFKSLMHQLAQAYLYLPDAKTKHSLDLFLHAVDQNAPQWIFLMTERWGGSIILRKAIALELNFLIEDLANDLQKIKSIQHIKLQQELKLLAQTLINLSFNWAMTWLNYREQYSGETLEQQQKFFKKQTVIQIQLLFRGILHWDSEKNSILHLPLNEK